MTWVKAPLQARQVLFAAGTQLDTGEKFTDHGKARADPCSQLPRIADPQVDAVSMIDEMPHGASIEKVSLHPKRPFSR